ncbi:MauE/DoxX family redox-associated membrane protein [Flocculibacter collagenilyticus]|uniref:MauE/DoxX family redox-associated membrane protein n=1 Tax=Flocculibacter collagenilyticus TaxID=2744479 RepID=UPI0018F6D1A1|nr:MauE/DoxX family redox-associated membrane protein [Flocculibacter collagenilyticus]
MTIYLLEIIRLFIGFVLVAGALGKYSVFDQFVTGTAEALGVSLKAVKFVAPIVILCEAAIGGSLVFKLISPYLLMWAALTLFVIFTGLIIYWLMQNAVISCHCFGEAPQPLTFWDLLRNILLLVSIGYFLLQPQAVAELDTISLLLAGGVAMILTLVIINFSQLVVMKNTFSEGAYRVE